VGNETIMVAATMACSSCFMVAVAPWNLKSPPPTLSSTHKFKFKCYATTQQQSLVHNDDLQALLHVLYCTSLLTSSIQTLLFLSYNSLLLFFADSSFRFASQSPQSTKSPSTFGGSVPIHSFIIHLSLLLINY
jgi:hypothetical protein